MMPVDVEVDADADAPDDGRGGGGSSGMLEAWEGVQFWTHLSGSRSLACISLEQKVEGRLVKDKSEKFSSLVGGGSTQT